VAEELVTPVEATRVSAQQPHEDQFAPVTAIHDVIKRASLLDSQLAAHPGRVAWAALHTDPFTY
jgi:hypothetical protein